MKPAFSLLIIFLFSHLMGCGDGGNGGTGGIGGNGEDPDTTAPLLSSTSPAALTNGIARNTTVTASFNEDMFAASIDGTSFTLASNGNLSGAVSFDAGTNVATFAPTQQLSMMTSYTATLSTAITDLSGNSLATDYSWSFTTGDGAWGSPSLIETDNAGIASDPRVAIDSSGNAIAVWRQSDGTRFNIYANRYVTGVGWGTAGLIENNNVGDVFGIPEIAIDSSGNAMAVWIQFDGIRNNVWANRYVTGGGWGTAVQIEFDVIGTVGNPQVALDDSGNAMAVWIRSDGIRNNVWAGHYVAATDSWGTAVMLNAIMGSAFNPQVAVDPDGNAVAVWRQLDGALNNMYANRYVAGTDSWGAAMLIENNNSGNVNGIPQVVVDSSGNANAVWWQSDGIQTNIYANRYVAGTDSWGASGVVVSDNLDNAQLPQIAIDDSGNAMAVWSQSDGIRDNIWASHYVAATDSWGTTVMLNAIMDSAYNPQIAVDPAGNAVAVWRQFDG
ncbi:MAG: Ig-like domain-containing protein, partial [bacterium]